MASRAAERARDAHRDDEGTAARNLVRVLEDRGLVIPGIPFEDGRQQVVALVGPTGVGKTTATAKLAVHYGLKAGKRIGLISVDQHRIAAAAQLRVVSDIAGIPLEVVAGRDLRALEPALSPDYEAAVVIKDQGRSLDPGGVGEALAEKADVEVRAIVTVYDILEHLPGREIDGEVAVTNDIQDQIESYLSEYAVA